MELKLRRFVDAVTGTAVLITKDCARELKRTGGGSGSDKFEGAGKRQAPGAE